MRSTVYLTLCLAGLGFAGACGRSGPANSPTAPSRDSELHSAASAAGSSPTDIGSRTEPVPAWHSTPKPSAGPAIPLKILKTCKLRGTHFQPSWCHGIYGDVTFTYSRDESFDRLAAECTQELGAPTIGKRPNGGGGGGRGPGVTFYEEEWRRREGPVQQVFAITTAPDFENPEAGGIRVVLNESVDPAGPLPTRWFRGAISPNPPAPLIDVPFLTARKADGVRIASFEGLMSSAGFAYTEKDAQVYSAYVEGPYDAVRRKAESWAQKNGYKKTEWSSFFRPGSGLFEFEVRGGDRPGHQPGAVVTMYVSGKRADHPIARIKQ